MARIPSWPLRLLANGDFATVEEASESGATELLGHLVLTRRGERDMCPGFGVPDPAFAELAHGDVVAGVALFGPDIDVVQVATEPRAEFIVDTRVEWA